MMKTLGMITALSLGSAQLSAQTPRTAPVAPPPSGWVGITYSMEGRTDREGQLIYSDYPVVVSVEPGSPAQRAGIAAGDTILAFNDRDLRRYAFPIREMIQPGKTFVIRARRGGSNRVTKLVVAERPTNQPEKFEMVLREGEPSQPMVPFVLAGPQPLVRLTLPRAMNNMSIPLAGAEVRALSAGLAKGLGVKAEGLFIVNVADGTPAYESGLRDGDVLLRAGNVQLMAPEDLRRVLSSDLNGELQLELLRERKLRTVTLKWQRNR